MVGAALTGDAPTTSKWWTFLLPTKVQLVLEVWWYSKEMPHIILWMRYRASLVSSMYDFYSAFVISKGGHFLLSWINFKIPAWISNHMPSKVWGEIIHPFPNCYHWSMGLDKQFHPTLHNGCNCLSILRFIISCYDWRCCIQYPVVTVNSLRTVDAYMHQ